ncbi:MAG: hypothetical protein P8J18_07450 [Halieaceae bacterium]|nr:hypothetical protein [Halieaceae bacterium]
MWLLRRESKDIDVFCLAQLYSCVFGTTDGISNSSIVSNWFCCLFHYMHFGVAGAGLQLATPNRMRA